MYLYQMLLEMPFYVCLTRNLNSKYFDTILLIHIRNLVKLNVHTLSTEPPQFVTVTLT